MTPIRLPLALCAIALAAPAAASTCLTFVENGPPVRYAQAAAGLEAGEARIEFIGHSTFTIETAAGAVAATDYAGWPLGPDWPDVVTMNHAHSTHYTSNPDPGIDTVLRGWNPEGDGPAEHHVEIEDLTIRNVTTDTRSWSGGMEADGNSIFVFEVGDLCIGHLGHLHHRLTTEHFATIGRLDVVMAPVDGSYTLALPAMIDMLKRFRASIVLPMHYFGGGTLSRFVDGMKSDFAVDVRDSPVMTVSARTLPSRPTVIVLPGR